MNRLAIASLGSGSKGNGTLVSDGETVLLIDLGFTLKETEQRLRRLGVEPASISAILVTHEHADHIHGVAPFSRKYGTAVYMSHGTALARRKGAGTLAALREVNCHRAFDVGSIRVRPVLVPHDAREPCQYVVEGAGRTAGILTDLGHITTHVVTEYAHLDALLLECNHDVQMLAQGPYPWALKQRVGGNLGHLNNEQAAGLLEHVEVDRLQHLVLSHLSEKNNQPDVAVAAVEPHLAGWSGELHVSAQADGLRWITLD